MSNLIVGYIDSYEFMSILVDKKVSDKNLSFYIIDDKNYKIKLEVLSYQEENDFNKYTVKFNPMISLHKEYFIEDNKGNRGKLYIGSIIRHPNFDKEFRYDGPLGHEYHDDYTIFRVWSPVAKELYVDIIGEETKRYPFVYITNGLWECKVKGNLDGCGYLYSVRVFDELHSIADPYAISSAPNAKYSYVIDKNKLYKMKYKKPYFSGSYTDAVIYEASVRDFTCDLDTNLKGTFLGMVENTPTNSGESTGLDYISSLGVTHLQLLPTYDFGGVDDLNKDEKYNWGYNPVGYFTPSGWLSKDPSDPYSRINELKMLIDECHKRGLRVVMDVVFNHVYQAEKFAFDFLVPGYFYRLNYDGTLNNASGCGNVCATERYMCSRFFRDVLKYYMKNFRVDGFRFDLMGLLDIETLNKAYYELKEIDPALMMYGEGWNMANPLSDEFRPHMYNHKKMPGIAFFNDRFRELLKGNQWSNSAGFAFGNIKSGFEIEHIISGSCLDYFKFDEPTQSINYVECHDNYTIYDYGKYVLGKSDEELYYGCKLALEMILMSEGIPFIHAGEEFLRTKNGVENSYNSCDSINKIDYARRDEYIDVVNSVRDLIQIRREYKELRLPDANLIEGKMHILEGLCNQHTIAYITECTGCDLITIIKNDEQLVKFEYNADMIYDGHRCNISKRKYYLIEPGLYLFKKTK